MGLSHLAAAALLIASASTLTAQTLAVEGDHFTVNGTPKFLIFISYFDAMRASSGTLDTDFAYIANTLHLDGVQIFPNWWDYGCSGTSNCYTTTTLMSVASPRPYGSLLRAGRMTQLRLVLDKAKQHGLVVDMSFARDTVCDTTPSAGSPCPSPLGVTGYKQQIKDALGELMNDADPNRFRHVLVDLQNEHDDGDRGSSWRTPRCRTSWRGSTRRPPHIPRGHGFP
jgi:hypothetical protein